jgi:pyruvate,water dikinase
MADLQNYVLWLEELPPEDAFAAGKKCSHLGEMRRAGLPVPPGFALTLDAYNKFLQDSGVEQDITDYLNKNKSKLEKDVGMFEKASTYIIEELILTKSMPSELQELIMAYYEKLNEQSSLENVPVAVRSSGPVSMPGQFDTFLNVRGEKDLMEKIIRVWASSFNARAMAYRLQRGMALESSPIGVAILKMINARSSGVMFTLDPINGDKSRIFIEGSWGLGESLVSGQVTPDKYILDKVTLDLSQKNICCKVMEMVYGPEGSIVPKDIEEERRNAPCLNPDEILELAKLGKRLEKHYGAPQDIEWAVDQNLPFPQNIFILQTRPETIWSKKPAKPVAQAKGSGAEIIARQLMKGFEFSKVKKNGTDNIAPPV